MASGQVFLDGCVTATLDESIQKLGDTPTDKHDELGLWIFPELLLRLEVAETEELLLKHWDKVRMLPVFVQTALFLATPKLVRLVNTAIAEVGDKKELFEHFSFTVGLHTSGRAGLTRQDQLEALRPYFHLFSDHDLVALWETCNKRNWRPYRREHLDPLIIALNSPLTNRLLVSPPFDMSDLDKELNGEHSFSRYWLEMGQRDGGERDELLAALLGWVQKNSNLAALDIVTDIYSREATRIEFLALEDVASQIPGSEHVVKRARFNIFQRTLV